MSAPDPPRGPEAELPPVDDLDELASALLDGEADEADRARLADPAVRDEVERRRSGFARVQAAVSAPVPVDPAHRDAAIAAALASATGVPPGEADHAAPGPRDELAARRATAGRGLRLVGAAAAVVAVVALGVSVLSGPDDADDSAGEATADLPTEGSLDEGSLDDGDDAAVAPDAAGEEAGDGTHQRFAVVGDFESVEALLDLAGRTAVGEYGVGGEVAPTVDTESTAGPGQVVGCEPPGEDAAALLAATVEGEPVEVWVVDGDVVVLDAAGCEELGRTTP